MAKRYYDLNGWLCSVEKEVAATAIDEIREMLTTMGLKDGDTFNLPVAPWESLTRDVVSIDFPAVSEKEDIPVLWCTCKTNNEFYPYNKTYTISARALVFIHSRVRRAYNKFLYGRKVKKEEM